MWFIVVEVEQKTIGTPPKKKPGSTLHQTTYLGGVCSSHWRSLGWQSTMGYQVTEAIHTSS